MKNETSNDFTNVAEDCFNFRVQGVEKPVKQGLIVALRPGSVAYRYAEMNSEKIVVHVRCRTIKFQRREFCAVFNAAHMGDKGCSLSFGEARDTLEFSLDGLIHSDLEQSVLVCVIEVSEDGKERRQFYVPSIVRLRRLDLCPHSLAKRSNVSLLSSVGKIAGRVTNGKLKDALVSGRIEFGFNDGDCVDELIQSTPEIVNAVGSDQGPPFEGRWFTDVKNDAKPSSLGVTVSEESMRVAFHPSPDLILDAIHVFMCPSELESDAVEHCV